MNGILGDIHFVSPEFFALLVLIPLGIFWEFKKKKSESVTLQMPDLQSISDLRSIRSVIYPYTNVLRGIALGFFVIALARPQLTLKEEEIKAEGIDIMMIMDISSSMLAQDFKPDRLEVSKKVAIEFVDKRPYDRIGLVVFSGESFTQCPLTTDHKMLKDFLDGLQCGLLEDGTAIGMGLASAVNRLKDSEAESKVIILLTDGVNNSGYIKPLTAAEIAQELNTKVYTIGVGSVGQALSPISRRSDGRYVFGMAKVEIDEGLLNQISEMTGGRYYRATDERSLEAIYAEIDRLEKTEMDITAFKRYSEEFGRFLFVGLLFLLLEIVLKHTLLKTLP